MGSNWPRVCIADVCELIVDCVNKTAPTIDQVTDFKMIRTPNVKSGTISTNDCKYVTAEVFDKWTRRARVQRNDVLLTREAPLGEVGIVNTDENIFLGQRIMQYRADLSKLDPHFLLYSFLSPDLQRQFLMHEGSGSVVSHIRVGDCSKFELNLPPLQIQQKIAGVLKNLDEKIILNRQINQTLEQMAQTLFKSWFVDFDPVIDNALDAGNDIPDTLQERAEQRRLLRAKADFKPLPAATSALFPSEFEETELGWVPKGWVYCRLVDIASISSGKRPPTKSDEKDGENFIPVWGGNGIKWFTNQYLFNNKYIITGRVGTLGTVYKVDGLSWPSDNALVINPHNKDCFEFIYQHLSNTDIESLNSGSTQPLVTQTALGNVDILLPNGVDILSLFQCQTGMFDRKITENMLQIECLSSLRNELLPKLISGELALDDLPEEITEAAEAV